MEYHLKNREEVEKFIVNEVLNSSEARDFLGITRARLSKLISDGKLIPIKRLPKDSWFLRSDLESKKDELEELRKKYRPYDEGDSGES